MALLRTTKTSLKSPTINHPIPQAHKQVRSLVPALPPELSKPQYPALPPISPAPPTPAPSTTSSKHQPSTPKSPTLSLTPPSPPLLPPSSSPIPSTVTYSGQAQTVPYPQHRPRILSLSPPLFHRSRQTRPQLRPSSHPSQPSALFALHSKRSLPTLLTPHEVEIRLTSIYFFHNVGQALLSPRSPAVADFSTTAPLRAVDVVGRRPPQQKAAV